MAICEEDIGAAWNHLDGQCVFVWKASGSHGVSSARPTSLAKAIDLCARMADWNAFLVLNPCTGSGKPSIDDITSVRRMMLDFDPKPDAPNNDWTFPYDELTGLLAEYGVSFHYDVPVIQSGRGIQFWVPVRQGDLSVRECHQAFKVIGKRVAEIFLDNPHWMFDTTCCDVSRIVRCPGTINHKTGRLASIAIPPHIPGRSGGSIDLATIDLPDAPQQFDPVPQATWMYIAPRIHHFNINFLLSGTSARRESRHGRLYNCAKDLLHAGLSKNVATSLLRHGAQLCTPNLLHDDPDAVHRVVEQLW